MRRIIITLAALTLSFGLQAQGPKKPGGEKFSPEKFDSELREFITNEAHLSQQEAAKFFPLFKEMQQKQRTLFNKQRQLSQKKPQNQEGCQQAIIEHDEMDVELKRIQQNYHKRFLEVLPADKVYDILKAESRFHRRMMKNWGQRHQAPHKEKGPRK